MFRFSPAAALAIILPLASRTTAHTVRTDGVTGDFERIDASGKVFSDHLTIALRDCRFRPAVKDGAPVAVMYEQSTTFRTN